MSVDENDVIVRLHAVAGRFEMPLASPTDDLRRGRRRVRRHRAGAVVATIAAVVVAVVAAAALGQRGEVSQPVGPVVPPTVPGANGWVALTDEGSRGSSVFLARPGEETRPLEYAGSAPGSEVCPVWSPDGTRLLLGRFGGTWKRPSGEPELVIVPIGRNGAPGTPTVVALDGFELPGNYNRGASPCATWAPDGRWVALPDTNEVWVVDTETGEVRRLPDLWPSDLAWRPGTDELAIAGDEGSDSEGRTLSTPITLYSVSTDATRRLGSIEAAHISWAPDGSTLAFTGGEEDLAELRLIGADGTDERVLVDTIDFGTSNHGVGPEWSPRGDFIVYQRVWDGLEEHRVVLVDVTDGSWVMLDPPRVGGGRSWYPRSVSWSPDGEALLFAGWFELDGERGDSGSGILVVPVAAPHDAALLADSLYTPSDNGWVATQGWGREPE